MKYVYIALASAFLLVAYAAQAAVNVNTADAQTLDKELVGVGPKVAHAIVVYRSKNGPFKSVDDLKNVKGLRKAVIDKNRNNISVSR
jgi:competence protein ComEA